MLLFPGGGRFPVITDLEFTDATNSRTPGQFSDDCALPCKRVECRAMLRRPTVLGRGREHRLLISNVGVLECELPNTELGKPFDVLPHQRFAIDVAARHDTGGSDRQAAGGFKELTERRRRVTHQTAVDGLVEVMA